MFDVFVDSSEVGVRKPERGIYEIALKEGAAFLSRKGNVEGREGLRPEECVMLDDLGMNLKTAKEMGMRTIRAFLLSSPPLCYCRLTLWVGLNGLRCTDRRLSWRGQAARGGVGCPAYHCQN